MLKRTSEFLILIVFLFTNVNVKGQVELVSTGAGGSYSLTFPGSFTYTNGVTVTFKANHTTPGTSTININSLGAKTIKKQVNTDLSANDILTGQVVTLTYDGTNFQMQSSTGTAGWRVTGNSGTNAATNFIGTTDAVDLVFKASNVERMRITQAGTLGIGITGPSTNHKVSVYRGGGDYGPDKTGIYSYRVGNTTSANGGTGWQMSQVDAAIKGFADYGNRYSAGIAGFSYFDYFNSAAIIGGNAGGSYYGMLGFRDTTGNAWGVYTPHNSYVGGLFGVGQTAGTMPTEKLDVVGNVKFSGALMPSGSAGTSGQVLTSGGAGLAPTWSSSIPSGSTNYIQNQSTMDQGASFRINGNGIFNGGRVLIGTTTGSSDITFGGNSSRTISVARNGTGSVGQSLIIEAGGGTSGLFDMNGGSLTLRSGLSTGTGISYIAFQTYNSNSASSSADNSLSEKMRLNSNGCLSIGISSPTTAKLYLSTPSTNTSENYGMYINNAYSGTTSKYGIYNNVTGDGSGQEFGIYNYVTGGAPNAFAMHGTANFVYPNGTGNAYALYNYISPNGSGTRYGMYTDVNTTTTNSSPTYGQYTIMDNDGTGNSYGLYINSIGATTANEYGLYVTGEDDNYFSGNIGIGVTNPTQKLEISGGDIEISDSFPWIYLNNTGTNNSGVSFQESGATIAQMYYNGTTDVLQITNSSAGLYLNGPTGRVGVSTTSPDQTFSVNGNASKSGGGTWAVFSDPRIKKNIAKMNLGLETISKINPIIFQYDEKRADDLAVSEYNKTFVGVNAEEIYNIPELKDYLIEIKEKYGFKDLKQLVNSDALMYISINAIKELNKKIEILESENELLRKTGLQNDSNLKSLKAEMEQIKSIIDSGAEAKINSENSKK